MECRDISREAAPCLSNIYSITYVFTSPWDVGQQFSSRYMLIGNREHEVLYFARTLVLCLVAFVSIGLSNCLEQTKKTSLKCLNRILTRTALPVICYLRNEGWCPLFDLILRHLSDVAWPVGIASCTWHHTTSPSGDSCLPFHLSRTRYWWQRSYIRTYHRVLVAFVGN